MERSGATIVFPAERFQFGAGLLLTLSLLWLAAPSSTVLHAQQTGPEVVYAQAPEWPVLSSKDAERVHKETVLVKIEVDGFGNVVDAKLLTPRSIYSNSAVDAARLWKFAEPLGTGPDVAKLNGMTAMLKFTFEILPASTSIYETGIAFIPPYEVYLGRLVRQKH